jgi:hypothetical protein
MLVATVCIEETAMVQTSAGVIRSLMLSAAAAALITAATAAGSGAVAQEAVAQESATPTPPVGNRWEAPVGHRQPRAQDLPRKVQETEGSRSKGETELGDKLKSICRGC